MIHTTEITSAEIASDNPIHQRLLFAYVSAADHVKGDLLDIGCGEGRGLHFLRDHVNSYTGIDKNPIVLAGLREKYPDDTFLQMNIPPFQGIKDDSFDTVVSFQVIEHIEEDEAYVREIHRVLKPGGSAILSTPNSKMSLTRNPWHVREYTPAQFTEILSRHFSSVQSMGVYGNEDVMNYYRENEKGVKRFTRFDIFNLQYKLPRKWLAIPYNVANRINRNSLHHKSQSLVSNIDINSFHLSEAGDDCFDLFYIAKK